MLLRMLECIDWLGHFLVVHFSFGWSRIRRLGVFQMCQWIRIIIFLGRRRISKLLALQLKARHSGAIFFQIWLGNRPGFTVLAIAAALHYRFCTLWQISPARHHLIARRHQVATHHVLRSRNQGHAFLGRRGQIVLLYSHSFRLILSLIIIIIVVYIVILFDQFDRCPVRSCFYLKVILSIALSFRDPDGDIGHPWAGLVSLSTLSKELGKGLHARINVGRSCVHYYILEMINMF